MTNQIDPNAFLMGTGGRSAKFEAEASFGSGKSKGERGEGSDRGVLGVVSDGHGWVISCWEE